MKGAIAVPERSRSTLIKSSVVRMGKSHHFLFCFKKPMVSPTRDEETWT